MIKKEDLPNELDWKESVAFGFTFFDAFDENEKFVASIRVGDDRENCVFFSGEEYRISFDELKRRLKLKAFK